MRKLLGLLVLTGLMTGVASAEILITQPGGGGSSSGSDLVAQAAAAAAAQAAANAQATANNAISNRGVQLNGSYLTNGTILTITGGGGGGGVSNVIVNGKTGVLSGSGSNIVSTVTLVAADVGAVALTGNVTRVGTLGGSNAVLQTDYPTLEQVQAIAASKVVYYLTTNITTAITNFSGDSTTVRLLSLTNPPTTLTCSAVYPALNSYPVAWVFTNQVFSGTYAGGLSHVSLWCRETTAGSASHKPEFYFISVSGSNKYEYVENVIAQDVPAGSTYVQQDWDITSVSTNLPEPCYGAIRMKVTAISLTPTVDFQMGNGTLSHLEMGVPLSVQLQPVYDLIGTKADTTTLAAHTNLTLAGGAHGGMPTAAQVGAVSNTAAGISAAGGVTGAVFAATGTQPSITLGLLSIPTNSLGGGGGSANAVTNNGATIVGYTLTNGATIDFPVALWSNPVTTASTLVSLEQATNVALAVVASASAPTYWITNTIVVSNSLDYAIPLAGNNVRVRWMAMFLSATNEAAVSKRATFAMFTRPDRLCDSTIYADTNQLYWAAPSTSAQAAGATTGTVADASGVVLMDRYAVGNGARSDFLTATNANATTIFWACTNTYATTADANTQVSHANYLTPVFYDDDSGTSNAWCRFAWATPYTGTVTTIVRYSK